MNIFNDIENQIIFHLIINMKSHILIDINLIILNISQYIEIYRIYRL